MPITTPDGQLLRANDGKLPLELVPPEAIWALARALKAGLEKYQARSYERGMPWSVPYACALRHLLRWFAGEEKDSESGLSALDHVLVNIAMLCVYEARRIGTDDRPKLETK